MPKIIHQREDCIGCNSCVEYASCYWKMMDDGKSQLIGATKKGKVYVKEIVELEVEQNEMAAISCPMRIIKIVNDQGKEII